MLNIQIEVAYALPDKQHIKALTVAAGCTVTQAVALSGITTDFPELQQQPLKLGIFSHLIDNPDQYVLADKDRVEIYRPLLLDPKEARRQRASKSRAL